MPGLECSKSITWACCSFKRSGNMASQWLADGSEAIENETRLLPGLDDTTFCIGHIYTKTKGKPHKVLKSEGNIRAVNQAFLDVPEEERRIYRDAMVTVQTACSGPETMTGFFRPYNPREVLVDVAPGYVELCRVCFAGELETDPGKPRRRHPRRFSM
jgi:hypothetical protein